jgi:hypothetical protein
VRVKIGTPRLMRINLIIVSLMIMAAISTRIFNYSCWIIGGLIALSALTKAQLLIDVFHFDYFLDKAIAIIYFSSAIIASAGLCRFSLMGFIFAYVYIIVATIFLSVSIIPFLFNLLRLDHPRATTLLFVVNLSILFATAFLHGLKRQRLKKKT